MCWEKKHRFREIWEEREHSAGAASGTPVTSSARAWRGSWRRAGQGFPQRRGGRWFLPRSLPPSPPGQGPRPRREPLRPLGAEPRGIKGFMVVAASHSRSRRKVSPLSAHSCTLAAGPHREDVPASLSSGSGPTAVPGPPPRRRTPVPPVPCSPCRGGRRASEPPHQAETQTHSEPGHLQSALPGSDHSACHHLLPRPVPAPQPRKGTVPPGHCQAGRREMWKGPAVLPQLAAAGGWAPELGEEAG